jgi:elongation factor Ts
MDKKAILKLREETGAGVMKAKQALEEFKGDYEKAKEKLMKEGVAKAAKKGDREIKAGLVWAYTHGGETADSGRIGVLVKVGCETDFVAKTEDFQKLCKEVAMQISAMDPKDVKDLLNQDYIRDPSKNIETLVKETIAKVGENIQIAEFSRSAI